jgi:hypothetical protein
MSRYSTYGQLDDVVAKDGDRGFIGFNNRLRPDQLQPGMLADAQNVRLDRNGEAQVRKGVELVLAPLAVGVDALTLPFDLPTLAQEGDSVTAILNDDAINEIYGSTGFSNPNDIGSQYIIIASNAKAIAINVADSSTTDIAYPSGLIISQSVDMIQAFNKVFIFRNGQTALEWDGDLSGTPAFTKVASGEYSQPVQIVCASGEFALIQNRGIVHQEDGVSVGSTITVIGDKTLSTDQTSSLIIGSEFVVSKVFEGGSTTTITAATSTPISGGEYDGLYKVTITAAGHGKNVGDPIDIAGFGDSKIDGSRFVAEVNGDDIVFYVPQNPNTTVNGGETVALAHGFEFYVDASKTDSHVTDGESFTSTPVFTRKVSVGLGFSHMPSPPFATYHQRRLVMPYRFEVDDTVDSFTSRGILDEVIASDILDTDTYDRIYAQYRFNAGTADYVVGLHSFAEDSLLVFNRNSIHLVQNTINLEAASTRLLTNEVGCVARKSIKQVGNQVIFLSDNGVYGTQFLDEYNLRGTETPLSEPINETIKRINKEAWDKAVAVYFDNRYYLAVPLDESSENNAILIYNFLNSQWESIDTVNDINYHTANMIVVGDGNDRGVYAVNNVGGVHQLDARADGVDRVIAQIGGSQVTPDIATSVTTRQYTLNTMDRKKWKEFDFHIQSSDSNTSDFDINIETENPDFVGSVGSLSTFNGSALAVDEDVSIRGRIGNKRGYGIQFTINNTSGRPRIRAIEVEGSVSMRSITKAI